MGLNSVCGGGQGRCPCQSQHPGPEGGLYPAGRSPSPQPTPGPSQLLTLGQSPHLYGLQGLVPQWPEEAPHVPPTTWALALDKHPHFPEEDPGGQREQVMPLRSLGL